MAGLGWARIDSASVKRVSDHRACEERLDVLRWRYTSCRVHGELDYGNPRLVVPHGPLVAIMEPDEGRA